MMMSERAADASLEAHLASPLSPSPPSLSLAVLSRCGAEGISVRSPEETTGEANSPAESVEPLSRGHASILKRAHRGAKHICLIAAHLRLSNASGEDGEETQAPIGCLNSSLTAVAHKRTVTARDCEIDDKNFSTKIRFFLK